jgi:hypothetical protein
MMKKFVFSLALTGFVAALNLASAPAQEYVSYQENRGFFRSCHYDFYRNTRWPAPFRAMDTSSVLSYFEVQRNNGWKLHNTLGTAMFDPNTHLLTDSGRAHLRWIVTNAPQERRVIFVLQGTDQQETAQRIESTQLAVSEMVPVGPLPKIYLTDTDSPGSSGVYQTAIVRSMTNSVPAPRLPANTAASPSAGATP